MRTTGSAQELEGRRRLAVQRVQQGYSQVQVAQFLGVHERTVRKWIAQYRHQGDKGLAAKPHPGRPPKLPRPQQNLVLGWLRQNPKSFGFATELWTGRRVAQLIKRSFGVCYHPRYINEWLTGHNFTPQKPQKRARERDEQAVAQWTKSQWPCLQNARAA